MKDFSNKILDLLQNDFSGLNLTRIVDEDEFYNKQIIDSVAPLEQCPEFKIAINQSGIVVDIGFGGGFPILPLAYTLPHINFIGMEARAKKANAVNSMSQKLNLPNVHCYHQRYEKVNFNKKVVITFKAVGPMKDLIGKLKYFTDATVFFYKGLQVDDLEGVPNEIDGWQLITNTFITVPGTDGRYIIGYSKKNVPRGTISNKELVNLSALV